MIEEVIVNVNLKFVVKETGMFPQFESKCHIECCGKDGKKWEGSISYDEGRSVEDSIKTICRMDSFKSTIPQLAVIACESTEKKVVIEEDPYSSIRSDLLNKKLGELRKIISDQNLEITTGGKKKEAVVESIIECLKIRDGLTKESENEKA